MMNVYRHFVKKLRPRRPRPQRDHIEPGALHDWADLPPHHPRTERD